MATDGNAPAAGRYRAADEAPGQGSAPPEIVIVPAHPVPAGQEGDLVFETREARGSDATVLPVFSTVRRLVDTLGPAQPWVAMPLESVRRLAGSAGVREVQLDPSAAADAWRWRYEDLLTLQGRLG